MKLLCCEELRLKKKKALIQKFIGNRIKNPADINRVYISIKVLRPEKPNAIFRKPPVPYKSYHLQPPLPGMFRELRQMIY
jgi:hypothetical protein